MWFVFAILSAVFASLTSILAKVGIEGVNSNLATAIRTVVVVIMAWGMVFLTNTQSGLSEIGKKSWLFLILSGLATGASWLCYYRALQMGDASKVVPIDKLSVVINWSRNIDYGTLRQKKSGKPFFFCLCQICIKIVNFWVSKIYEKLCKMHKYAERKNTIISNLEI